MATPQKSVRIETIASRQHTAGALALILMFAVLGRLFVTNRPNSALQNEHVTVYLLGIGTEWLLFSYVRLGLMRRQRITVRQVVDQSPWSLARWALYAGIAAGAAVVWMGCGFVLGRFLDASPDEVRQLRSLLPYSVPEKTLWIALSSSAAFCEEFVYRGYLQQQFRALTGSMSLAVVLQAITFGLAHIALPWQIAVTTAFLALLLGGVAAWRRSLVPGMMLHAGFDILAGVLGGS